MEKDEQDTFIFAFPYCDMDKEIIMEVPELLIKVIVTWIMVETVARTSYNRCKVVHHFVEEAGHLFEEVLHIHPTCYSMLHNMYTWCLMSAYIQWK